MERFRNWYVRNQDAITWFLIGWMTFAGLENLFNGEYVWSAINFAFAYVNYKFLKVRIQ